MESSNQEKKRLDKLKTINLRERNNKEDNRQNRNKEINRNFREKMQQKKPPGHKFIKKSTRRRDIIICFSVYLYLIDSYNC
jgi:hypothetical protein